LFILGSHGHSGCSSGMVIGVFLEPTKAMAKSHLSGHPIREHWQRQFRAFGMEKAVLDCCPSARQCHSPLNLTAPQYHHIPTAPYSAAVRELQPHSLTASRPGSHRGTEPQPDNDTLQHPSPPPHGQIVGSSPQTVQTGQPNRGPSGQLQLTTNRITSHKYTFGTKGSGAICLACHVAAGRATRSSLGVVRA
jgi:hypothetical protein